MNRTAIPSTTKGAMMMIQPTDAGLYLARPPGAAGRRASASPGPAGGVGRAAEPAQPEPVAAARRARFQLPYAAKTSSRPGSASSARPAAGRRPSTGARDGPRSRRPRRGWPCRRLPSTPAAHRSPDGPRGRRPRPRFRGRPVRPTGWAAPGPFLRAAGSAGSAAVPGANPPPLCARSAGGSGGNTRPLFPSWCVSPPVPGC